MKKYSYGILLNALFVTGMISGANVSCDERMRHGPKGLAEGGLALREERLRSIWLQSLRTLSGHSEYQPPI